MLKCPMEILTMFPVRKTKQQKMSFRDAVQSYVKGLGYESREEQGRFGCCNLVIGDPESAKYLVTAHYDTCARMLLPNWITPCDLLPFFFWQIFLIGAIIAASFAAGMVLSALTGSSALGAITGYFSAVVIVALMLIGPANPQNANDNSSGVITLLEIARTLPENQRHKVCFVLFDLEEAGLIGSSSYRKTHREATNRQLILNLDCVGDGDQLRMFPTKALRNDRRKLTSLYKACGYFGKKSLLVHEKGFSIYPSDQMNFPYGVGLCALRPGKFGLQLSRIHTPKDTVLEQTNINILRAALTTFICCDAAQ